MSTGGDTLPLLSTVATANTVTRSEWNAPGLTSRSSHDPSMTLIHGFSVGVSTQTRRCAITGVLLGGGLRFDTKTDPAWPTDSLVTGSRG